MSEFYTRDMVLSDIPFFMKECEDGAKNSHFHKDILTLQGNKIFEKQIRDLIKVKKSGQYTRHLIILLVRRADNKKVVFLWLYSSQDLSGRPCIDIKVINITKSMRGKGGGSQLLLLALNTFSHHILTATCYQGSPQMAEMLKRRGFKVMQISERGSEFLFLEPK